MAGSPGHRPTRRMTLADPVAEAIDVTPNPDKRAWLHADTKEQIWLWCGFFVSGFAMGAAWAWQMAINQ